MVTDTVPRCVGIATLLLDSWAAWLIPNCAHHRPVAIDQQRVPRHRFIVGALREHRGLTRPPYLSPFVSRALSLLARK